MYALPLRRWISLILVKLGPAHIYNMIIRMFPRAGGRPAARCEWQAGHRRPREYVYIYKYTYIHTYIHTCIHICIYMYTTVVYEKYVCTLFSQVGDRLLAVNGKLVTDGHECICIYIYISITYINTSYSHICIYTT